jgi:endonuclease/exonuclease/phosphatase (EEP) superfamily protein YafD
MAQSPTRTGDRRGRGIRLLRRRTWFCGACAAVFIAGCAAVVALVVLYHWPRASVPVYYFTVRPAFVWFGMVAPAFAVGLLGVRWQWVALGVLLWCAGLLATEEWVACLRPPSPEAREEFSRAHTAFLASPADHAGAAPLRIVSWNVLGGRRGAKAVVEQMAALEPDLVLMQEASETRMAEFIRSSPYFSSFHYRDSSTAVLSRFPVEPVAEDLPRWRGAAYRVTIGPGRTFVCVNVHVRRADLKTQLVRGLSLSALAKAVRQTRAELEGIRSTVARYVDSESVIVAGDFNLPPHYAGLRRALSPLRDCFARAGSGWGRTAPARMPLVRIDMLFAPPDARIFYCAALDAQHSDHLPLVAEIALPLTDQEPESNTQARRAAADSRPHASSVSACSLVAAMMGRLPAHVEAGLRNSERIP